MSEKKRKNHQNDESYFLASQWTLMRRKLMKHGLARFSMVLLGLLYCIAIFGNGSFRVV